MTRCPFEYVREKPAGYISIVIAFPKMCKYLSIQIKKKDIFKYLNILVLNIVTTAPCVYLMSMYATTHASISHTAYSTAVISPYT